MCERERERGGGERREGEKLWRKKTEGVRERETEREERVSWREIERERQRERGKRVSWREIEREGEKRGEGVNVREIVLGERRVGKREIGERERERVCVCVRERENKREKEKRVNTRESERRGDGVGRRERGRERMKWRGSKWER